MSAAALVFWGAVGLALWTYAGFPAALWLRAKLFPRPFASGDALPRVSLIVCAYDEADAIGRRLENALALDYPRERLELIVASDGSTDGTNEIVAGFAARGVRLLALPRQGKIPALNAAIAASTGEVLCFSDANSMWVPGAIRALVRPLADPAVGGVAGDQRYLEGEAAAEGERTYWDLDRALKRWQSAAGSVTSSTGAIHAIRREHFRPVPPGVTDDFWLSTQVVAQGRRLVFAPDAVAWEPAAASSDEEFRRKVRVITRGLHGVELMRELLDPVRHGFYALQLLSHKVLRRLAVLPLAAILLATPWLWNAGPLYRAAALAQAALYGAALVGSLLPLRGSRLARLIALPAFFCMANAAAGLAAWNVLRGVRIDSWQPQRAGALGGGTPR